MFGILSNEKEKSSLPFSSSVTTTTPRRSWFNPTTTTTTMSGVIFHKRKIVYTALVILFVMGFLYRMKYDLSLTSIQKQKSVYIKNKNLVRNQVYHDENNNNNNNRNDEFIGEENGIDDKADNSARLENHFNNRDFLKQKKLIKDKSIYKIKKKWFLEKCLENVNSDEMKLENLDEYLDMFKRSSLDECKLINFIFNSMFDLEVTHGEIAFESAFKKKLLKWLDNNEEYLKLANKQKVVKLYNKYYMDEMIYNSLRGKRPIPKQQTSEKNYTDQLVAETELTCDFCENNYKDNTASDVFGRIETPFSYSTANAFKYDKWHSLIVSRKHNPLNLTQLEVDDMFDVSLKWFKKVNEIEPAAQYPEMIWDAMIKSGASQVHTHLQASMGLKSYYGAMRRWLDASESYFLATYRDFYDDFILIHRALGLVYEYDQCLVILNLIPIKDQEVMIVCENYLNSFKTSTKLIHQILRIFIDKFEQYSFSFAMYLPKYENFKTDEKSNDEKEYNPSTLTKISTRLVFRSPVNTYRSDFNGLDLYTSSVIGIDRYDLARKLFNQLDKFNQAIHN